MVDVTVVLGGATMKIEVGAMICTMAKTSRCT